MLLMLVVCVMLIDTFSERLRHRLLSLEGRA
jgi:ABC-type phosphate/phosphonate transport system permease subunit